MILAIDIDKVSRKYGAKTVLNKVSLRLEPGKVLGLIGENGAGKTTLIRHVLGMLRAEEGSVRVFGLDPVASPAEVLGNIGYLAEEDSLPGWMRVHELQRYYRGFYPGWDQAYAEELRETFQLDRRARLKELSKGQRARVGLMGALAYRPKLLVLDEPSSGLDPIVRREILTTIVRSVARENRAVLFSSHLLTEIEMVADEVAMIKGGELVFCNSLDAIKESHRRVTLAFKDERLAQPVIEGAFCWSGGGREWSCLYAGSPPALEAAAALAGSVLVDQSWLTLDEIFIARSRDGARHD